MRRLEIADSDGISSALHEVLRDSAQARYLNRLLAVLLVARGNSCYEVSSWLDCSPRTLEAWVHRYALGGVDELRDRSRARGSSRLTSSQICALSHEVRKSPRAFGYSRPVWSGRLLKVHLQREYRLRYSVRHCQRLLRQLSVCRAVRRADPKSAMSGSTLRRARGHQVV